MYQLTATIARLLDQSGLPATIAQALSAVLFISSVPFLIMENGSALLAALLFLIATGLELTSRHMLLLRQDVDPGHLSSVLLRFGGYGIFFTGLGLHLYRTSDYAPGYPLALLLFALLWIYIVFLIGRYPVDVQHAGFGLHRSDTLRELKLRQSMRTTRLLFSISVLFDPGIFPLLVFVFVAAGLHSLLFWLALLVLIFFILFKLQMLRLLEHELAREISRGAISYLFYIAGASVLLLLVLKMPFSDLAAAISVVGQEDAWIILIPALWVIPYAITLQVLLDYRVKFLDALYTQISGDAFNSITPLLGMGGEPYKAGHLSRYVPIEDASRAIIQSRLIHALTGVLFTIIILLVTVSITDLSAWPGAATAMIVIAIILSAVFLLLLWATMSRAPTQVTVWILTRLKIPGDFQHQQLGWRKLILASLCRMAGRSAKFLELYLIFVVLDMSPEFSDVVLVEAMIMISVSLFFFVPQGIGVNETGIVTAFTIIGYSAAMAVAFGLIRRARMIIYTLAGLLVYLIATLMKLRRKRAGAGAG